jgi:hypothetical protein
VLGVGQGDADHVALIDPAVAIGVERGEAVSPVVPPGSAHELLADRRGGERQPVVVGCGVVADDHVDEAAPV